MTSCFKHRSLEVVRQDFLVSAQQSEEGFSTRERIIVENQRLPTNMLEDL